MDIGAAYLNAYMASTEVDVDMVIDARLTTILVELDPTFKEFVRPDGTLCVRLIKALYGTVEAARLWYELITKVLQAGPASNSRIFHPTRFAGRFRTPKNAVYMAEKRIFFCVA